MAADDAAAIKAALARDPSLLNAQDVVTKRTALMSAALGGMATAAHALLYAGADWTISEKDGYNPLHGAACA